MPAKLIELASLGPRIIVMGPSNAGKSTLSVALSRRLGIGVVHLDQLRHVPNTDWEARSEADFIALHDQALDSDSWVIDGNYDDLLERRLQRATGVILLDAGTVLRLGRYLRRTLIAGHEREGGLQGAKESLKWSMIDWILFRTRNSAAIHADVIRATGKPFVECRTPREVRALYRFWGLSL